VCLVWACGYLTYFGAVSPLLRGIDVRRVDCAIYYRSRICQRISIGWSWLSANDTCAVLFLVLTMLDDSFVFFVCRVQYVVSSELR